MNPSLIPIIHDKMHHKYCCVPQCLNSTIRTPDKKYVSLPKDPKRRNMWLKAMRNSDNTAVLGEKYVCEDHFDLEQDMENYIKYKLVGGKIKLKNQAIPHIFNCQADRKAGHSVRSRPAVEKRKRLRHIQDAIAAVKKKEEEKVKSCLVPECKNTCISTPQLIFFKVPESEEGRKRWEEALNVIPKYYESICELHFKEDDILRHVFFDKSDPQKKVPYQLVRLKLEATPTVRKRQPIKRKFKILQPSAHQTCQEIDDEIRVTIRIAPEPPCPIFQLVSTENGQISLPPTWVKINPRDSNFIIFATFSCPEFTKMVPYKEVHINEQGIVKYLCYGKEVEINLEKKLTSLKNLQLTLHLFDSYELCDPTGGDENSAEMDVCMDNHYERKMVLNDPLIFSKKMQNKLD